MKITLTCEDLAWANGVLLALGKFPHDQVDVIITSFRKQIAEQTAPPPEKPPAE
jgi:hypothetical protein